jgi:peptide/nickel transport system substrate-binding protein
MHRKSRVIVALAAASLLFSLILTGSMGASASTGGEKNILPPITNAKPVYGGTLKIVGSGDVDHLDTCCAYYTTTYELLRMVSRQLVSYPATTNIADQAIPIPDMATFSISKNGLNYTFKIKKGVMWDAPTGARQVTSEDEVRGLKRLCNPVSPAPPLPYWTNNIVGMKSYCAGFQAIKLPTSSALEVNALNSYMNSHQISGLSTPNSSTLVITLLHPSSAFINIMAMPMSSPVPAEINNYLPASVELAQHWISDGPYTITSYTPNVSYTLVKNPAWEQSSDPIRHQYFNAVDITMGESATAVQEQLETGAADLEWDTTVPTAEVPGLVSSHNPGFIADFFGGIEYMVFNVKSTANNGALQKVAVRQALQYCVNKRHLIQVSGGPVINAASNHILPPQITGYVNFDPYPSTDSEGNPSTCASLLAKAGFKKGLTLTIVYPDNPPYPAQVTAMQADFAKAGVTLKFNEQPTQGAYFDYVETPSNLKNWDLAIGLWFPDWDGNGAQSFFSPLLDGRQYTTGSTDYGDYNDPAVDSLIDKALSTGSVSAAAKIWAQADKVATVSDPAWVPLLNQALPQFVGTNVVHAIYVPFIGSPDPTNLWVK